MGTGDRGLYVDGVAALLGLFRVPAKRREELLDLVRNGSDPNWWHIKALDIPSDWRDLMSLESEATAILNFESLVVPGLLQTDEYATALLLGISAEVTESSVTNLVAM